MRACGFGAPFLLALLASLGLFVTAANSRGEEPKNSLRLIFPPVIYATEGIEANVYLDNVVLTTNPANYAFDIICTKGRQQQERNTMRNAHG